MITMKRTKIDVDEVVRLKELGYTQKQIAERMNVTQQAISFVFLQRRDREKQRVEIGVRI